MTDLRLDYQLLDQIKTNLGNLAAEFESIEATQDGYNGAMGAPEIVSAMNGFAGNWTTHRQKMTASMRALQQMSEGTKEGFSMADDDLSRQITFGGK